MSHGLDAFILSTLQDKKEGRFRKETSLFFMSAVSYPMYLRIKSTTSSSVLPSIEMTKS